MESEEQHRHVLRRAHDRLSRSGVAIVRVTLIQRERMILRAWKLFTLHHPSIEHLKGKYKISDQKLLSRILFGMNRESDLKSIRLNYALQ